MDNHVTIDDVSIRAGVSKTTVSRYLNGKYEHMSKKTKLKIEGIIDELDYRPNMIAKSLKSKKTGLIGVIVSDVTNPVTVTLIKGIIDYCTQQGYQVVTASSDEKTQNEEEYVMSMVDRQVEGLIVNIVDYHQYTHLESLVKKGVKIVLADRTISEPVIDMVTTDNYAMTCKTIKKLYALGYDIVSLFSSNLLMSNVRLSRYNAFLDESAQHISDPSRFVYLFNEDREDDYKRALEQFLSMYAVSGKKVAIFAATPMALSNLLGAAYELGIKIPEDLGICAYDNLPWTKFVNGGITVVNQPFYEVGVESAKILIKRIQHGVLDDPKYVELKSQLILRNSTNI